MQILIKHGNRLTHKERQKLTDLFKKYRSCFAINMSEVSMVHTKECEIIILTDEPVSFRPYRLSKLERILYKKCMKVVT